jgi:4-hydroxy-2-oxoheptanedioate aldolase
MDMTYSKRELLQAGMGAGIAAFAGAIPLFPARGQDARGAGQPVSPAGALPAQYEWSGRQPASVDPGYKPRRMNKVIELFEDDQPIYYVSYSPATGDGYQAGRLMAKTWADCICIEIEQGAADFTNLRDFMRGLADGGPTRSGHRMPATFVTMPNTGLSASAMQATAWMFNQVLSAGVMGVNICHARDPGAVEVAVQAMRFPFDYPGVRKLANEGLRGSGSQLFASRVWGMAPNHYLHIADLWPLNPKGEIMLGLKIEDKFALANCEKSLAVPGVTFAEWGPGDMNMSLNGLDAFPDLPPRPRTGGFAGPSEQPANLIAARARVLAACKANNVRFLDANNARTIVASIRDGARVMETNEETALIGREFTKRRMPV